MTSLTHTPNKVQHSKGYVRKTVRVSTYKTLIKEFPSLKDKNMMGLFMSLVYGKKDRHTGMPLVGIAHCSRAFKNKTTNNPSLPRLQKMQSILGRDNFIWGGYNHAKRECRTLTTFNLPQHIITLMIDEIHSNAHAGTRVYLDGKPYKRSGNQMEEINLVRERDPKFHLLKHTSQAEVLEYLNDLHPKHYQKIFKYNYTEAFEATKALTKNRDDTLNFLHCLWEDCETPYYALSENTYRLYPTGASIVQLPSAIRKKLTKDWYEVDLKSAQLAIISRLWNIPTLKAFLESGQSFWTHCLTLLELEVNETNKKWLKELSYALAFGAGELGFKGICAEHSMDFSYYKAFREINLVADIFKARKRRMKFFKDNNYVHTDCYGYITQVHPTEAYRLLAREAQALEFLLMTPLFQYCISRSPNEICVTLFQHDGVSLYIRTDPEKHFKNIDKALAVVTKKYDIPTYYEYERL